MNTLFTLDNGRYLPTPYSLAGWNNSTLHGGPVAALLGHGIEAHRLKDPELLMTRLTVDLLRPVRPIPLALTTDVVREGKRLKLVDARLSDGDNLVARASGLMLRRPERNPGETTRACDTAIPRWSTVPLRHWVDAPGFEATPPTPEAAMQYHRMIEVRCVNEPRHGEPFRFWGRVPFELTPGVPLSPFTRAAAVADFASAVGLLSRRGWMSFINADIALTLHREPEGEWLFLECAARGDRDGIASSSVNLHDTKGLFGHSAVCGVANAMPAGGAA